MKDATSIALLCCVLLLLSGLQMALNMETRARYELQFQERVAAHDNMMVIVDAHVETQHVMRHQNNELRRQNDLLTNLDRNGPIGRQLIIRALFEEVR